MASINLASSTRGHLVVSIQLRNFSYERRSVLLDFRTNVLLGNDFLRLHKSVQIPFPGSKPSGAKIGSQ